MTDLQRDIVGRDLAGYAREMEAAFAEGDKTEDRKEFFKAVDRYAAAKIIAMTFGKIEEERDGNGIITAVIYDGKRYPV